MRGKKRIPAILMAVILGMSLGVAPAMTYAEPETDVGAAAEEEKELSDRARRKKLRKGVVIGCAVLVLAGAGYAFRQQLSEWIGSLTGHTPEVSAPAAAVATPAPVRS